MFRDRFASNEHKEILKLRNEAYFWGFFGYDKSVSFLWWTWIDEGNDQVYVNKIVHLYHQNEDTLEAEWKKALNNYLSIYLKTFSE